MCQSFVTTAPMGLGNSGDSDFLFANPGYMPSTRGHFYGQSPETRPAQILAGKYEITPAGLGIESKVCGSMSLWGLC